MSARFKYISAFLCEKVLNEDGVISAIRIVDTFRIPHDAPEEPSVHFFAVAALRNIPAPSGTFKLEAIIVSPSGKREVLPLPGTTSPLIPPPTDPSIPSGLNIILDLTLKIKSFGTGFLEIVVDGVTEATLPFTVVKLPQQQSDSAKPLQ